MTARTRATKEILEAQDRFRSNVAGLPLNTRRALARATRELANVIVRYELSEGLALEDLADLVDVIEPRSLPPDHEGDEELLARRDGLRAGWDRQQP